MLWICICLLEAVPVVPAALAAPALDPLPPPPPLLPPPLPIARSLHSSAFPLNVSAFCGIGGAFECCIGGV
jgi:hypothetical protein